jgi:nucleotide-binding universal stress UspA family protein
MQLDNTPEEHAMIRHILVGLDGSTSARRALDLALDLAPRLEASLRLAHVVELPTPWYPVPSALGGPVMVSSYDWVRDHRKHVEEEGRTLITQAADLCRSRGVPCQAVTTCGWAPRVLHQQLAEVELGIFGRTGRRQDVDGETTGATAQYLIRRATTPTVLVDRDAVSPRRVLFGWDNSPGAQRALLPAAELARRTGFELHVLHVKRHSDERNQIDSAKKALAGDTAVRMSFEEVVGRTYDVLAARLRAQPDTLLALGARGHDRLADFLLGTLPESFHYHDKATLLVAR